MISMSKVVKEEAGGNAAVMPLIKRVFETRNDAHFAHWRAKSGFRHEALGDFYGQVIDQIDAIAEDFQGMRGQFKTGPTMDDMRAHLEAEAKWIADNRERLAGGCPSVLNKIDDLIGIYSATLYKIRDLE